MSKSYVGTIGDKKFSRLMVEMLLGKGVKQDAVGVVQTPGGVSALRLLFELVQNVSPDVTIWMPDPTWGNHLPVARQTGLKTATYAYYDPITATLGFEAMLASIRTIIETQVGLLQRDFAIYVMPNGRCHIAGLREGDVPYFARAVASILDL